MEKTEVGKIADTLEEECRVERGEHRLGPKSCIQRDAAGVWCLNCRAAYAIREQERIINGLIDRDPVEA